MRVLLKSVIGVALLTGTLNCASPQTPQPANPSVKPKTPTGTVTGTVYCADTNRPARLAHVLLSPMNEEHTGWGGEIVADLDGRFAFADVPEGKYYVVARMAGYLDAVGDQPGPQSDDATQTQNDAAPPPPIVTVSATLEAEMTLRLERGVEMDGTILFDDGSPATSLPVTLSPLHQRNFDDESHNFYFESFPSANSNITDDRGRFHIIGMRPGEYLLWVTVPGTSSIHPATNLWVKSFASTMGGLTVYAGDTFRKSKARIFKLEAGDAIKDADITIPLNKLHTVSGQVMLKDTGQAPPAAVVQLVYADTREWARVIVAPDGKFEFSYIPEENFFIQAKALKEALPDREGKGFNAGIAPMREEEDGVGETPLLVTQDMENLTITVPDPPGYEQSAQAEEKTQSVQSTSPSDDPK